MTQSTTDRRKFLAVGGVVLMTGLAGCSVFRDGQDVPGDTEPPDEPQNDRHPINPIGYPDGDDEDEEDENGDGDDEDGEEDDDTEDESGEDE